MTMKRISWVGVVLFSFGLGCSGADSSGAVASDIQAVQGSTVSAEQVALPDADGPGSQSRPGRVQPSELSELTRLLGLSAEQVAAIGPILDATRTALADIRAQVKAGTLSPADAQAQVKAAHDQQKTQILALLTAEQQAKFSQMHAHHRDPFDLDRLTAALGLSADQVSQIRDIMSAADAKLSAIHSQVEAGTLSLADAHAQLDQIHKDTQAAIQGVLTADQQAELAKLLAAHPGHGSGPPCGAGGGGSPAPAPSPGTGTGGTSSVPR